MEMLVVERVHPYYISHLWHNLASSFNMSRLRAAFSHLLPILDVSSAYIPSPIFNSTAIDEDDAVDSMFLHNILHDATQTLLPPPDLLEDDDASDTMLSPLTFHTGRKRGQACSYNGYIYALNKSKPRKTM